MSTFHPKQLHRPLASGRLGILWRRTAVALLAIGLALLPALAGADNIAQYGTGILGYNAAVDGAPGTLLFHAGTAADINDQDAGTHVDNFSGGSDQGQGVSFVGIVWPTQRFERIDTLTLTMATFLDGGWFGPTNSGPGAGGALASAYLTEPTVQVSTNGGVSWTTVASSSDYLTALDGATIGGGANPNPNPLTATFTINPPVSNINGIRLIGPNGGTADGNGFLGVSELEVNATFTDSEPDGMPDAWEQAHGLSVGTDDAFGDPDGDGLINIDEYQHGTDPQKADTDGDGLSDNDEVLTYGANPLSADTDGDGLNDGEEVNTYHTDPTLPDTDFDGISDGDEVNTYKTDPLNTDTDNDGYSDGVEVSLASDPKDPNSIPGNLAIQGLAIMGTESSDGVDTSYSQAGSPLNINDGNLNTHVDTWNNTGTDPKSFVGITWTQPITKPVVRLELTLATFVDGGWFGRNGSGPGAGAQLTPAYLSEPDVQISIDGGLTWSNAPHTSDYLTALNGHVIGVPNPSPVKATFILSNPVPGISGIRIIGREGGTASGGFLGVFELGVYAKTDSDNDGMDDDWETKHGLVVGVNDAALDPDQDGLTNLQEYNADTDPQKADTDGDGLKDGAEVNTYSTNPLSADTDGDGLSDGAEVNTHHTNPLSTDTDGDQYKDGLEVTLGSDPTSATSIPANLALRSDATGILGTEDAATGIDTPVANAGSVLDINDNNLATRVDTWNGASPDTMSYVGIVWNNAVTNPVVSIELSLATFFDGGWFGVNGITPGSGAVLSTNTDLLAPDVQISNDGGVTWSNVNFSSDYLTALEGHPLPAVDFGPATLATAHFTLATPPATINGIRVIGSEGGLASGGFLGVFEMAVKTTAPQSVTLTNVTSSGGQFHFEFQTEAGASYIVQYKTAFSDSSWQNLATVTGDGATKPVTDTMGAGSRFYRVARQ